MDDSQPCTYSWENGFEVVISKVEGNVIDWEVEHQVVITKLTLSGRTRPQGY